MCAEAVEAKPWVLQYLPRIIFVIYLNCLISIDIFIEKHTIREGNLFTFNGSDFVYSSNFVNIPIVNNPKIVNSSSFVNSLNFVDNSNFVNIDIFNHILYFEDTTQNIYLICAILLIKLKLLRRFSYLYVLISIVFIALTNKPHLQKISSIHDNLKCCPKSEFFITQSLNTIDDLQNLYLQINMQL